MKIKNHKSIIIFCSILLFLLIYVFGIALVRARLYPSKKETITTCILWRQYTFEEAIHSASTIVYGRVSKKSNTLVHELFDSSGDIHREYYKEVTIEIIDLLKGEAGSKITYLEMAEEETATSIYIIEGIEPTIKGEEYIYFLNEYGTFLAPTTLIPVLDGNAMIEGKIVPEVIRAKASPDIAVNEYLDFIKIQLESGK